MTQIKPITFLRNTSELSRLIHQENETIFLTKNGYGDMVILSIDKYNSILNMIKDTKEGVEQE
mgnify:CR=1 FL=1